MTTNSALQEAADLINNAKHIAIASHLEPDPDAVGSTLGLGLALREQDKHVAMLNDGPVRESVLFLPAAGQITDHLPDDFEPDLFIGLDSSDGDRLGDVSAPLMDADIPVLVIDHHATNLYFGDVNVVMVEAAATAEQIVYLLDEMGQAISQQVAECLMAGLIGDTVGFSVSSTTPQTMRVASRLMEAGASLHDLTDKLLNTSTLQQIKLWGMGMLNTFVEEGVLISQLPYGDRKKYGLEQVSRTRLSNMLLSVGEANIAASFSEQEDGTVDISLRARPGYDVGSIALGLGGGGHRLAAGASIEGPLTDAVGRVLDLLKEESARGPREDS